MGCNSCSSGGCGTSTTPKGCKNNGGCSTGGCNRMNVFDWLSDMELPTSFEEFDIVEIRFKGGRKDFFRNTARIALTTGDAVVVDVPNGYHIGFVSLKGELVRLQMLKKKVDNNEEIRSIYRIATEKDMEKFDAVRELESGTMYRTREIVQELGLKMKVSDVEYQADRSKATFYYSADDRVDFRDLIKKLAEEFKVRVEMRQISLRHEAGRLGGIGSCGRELCCSTWLSDFKSVSTTAARYQNLSLNPSKLSGQCGRLKCCLNYELETYMDALKDIPTISRPLQLQRGDAMLQKTDIFRKMMWFGFKDDTNWYPVPVERVREILEMNAKGELPELLVEEAEPEEQKQDSMAQLEGSLERLDDKFKSKRKKKKKKKAGTPERVLDSAIPGAKGENPEPAQLPQTARTEEGRNRRNDRNKDRNRDGNRPNREPRAEGRNQQRPENRNQQQKQAGEKPERENRPERTERPERRERRPENREPREPRPAGKPEAKREFRNDETPGEGRQQQQPANREGSGNRRRNRPPRKDKPAQPKPTES